MIELNVRKLSKPVNSQWLPKQFSPFYWSFKKANNGNTFVLSSFYDYWHDEVVEANANNIVICSLVKVFIFSNHSFEMSEKSGLAFKNFS